MKTWTLQDVADHWDNSPDYDDQNAKIDSYMRRFRDSAPLFDIPKDANVLDCDCRTGNGTVFFTERYKAAKFHCVAMAPTFVERAEKNLTAHNVDANVQLMTDLKQPFEDETFDVILSYETLEHVPWPTDYIAELSRMLKEYGTLVLTTPNVLWEPVHFLSALLKFDHGEGPHRMVPRKEILAAIAAANLQVETEKTFVLVPAGPKWLLQFGYWLESVFPEWLLRIIALRRTFICRKADADTYWQKLKEGVIDTGLDTSCGTAVGVSNGTLQIKELNGVPTIVRSGLCTPVPEESYAACPARHCNYTELNQFVFGQPAENLLAGTVQKAFIGHATDEGTRRAGASGGVITQTLIDLLEAKKIAGAVCLQMGAEVPWRAKPVVARTKDQLLACAQSVYSATPTNVILEELAEEEGPLAYVGLPDQVAGIRKLQMLGHPSVQHIKYVLGPYTGTQMEFEAIRSFLRSHGINDEHRIANLQYRAGEWPGHLQITLDDGTVLKAEKFYYNYLIPFFITRGCLQIPDFTNELTDISVGDAWSPALEKDRKGHSVILARTQQGLDQLESMQKRGIVALEEIELTKALDMHGHMLDLKKRGSFIRNSWKKVQPEYGYVPEHIPTSRIGVEWVLRILFGIGQLRIARFTVEHIPLSIVGPCFNALRKSWKNLSKPTKRKGLRNMKFRMTNTSLTTSL